MPLVSGYLGKRIGWFRICGFGLAWRDTRLHPLLFSERNGYTLGIRFFGWFYIKPLWPKLIVDDKSYVRSLVPPDWVEVPCKSKPQALWMPDGKTVKLVPFAAFENPDATDKKGKP